MTATPELPVAIIGSGFSGIAMGAYLRKAGIESFVILEKAGGVGGTWRENTYPGAACDVPSHLYSFSFAPNPDWSYAFSPQAEIEAYLKRCVVELDLARHIRFHHEVTRGDYDDATGTWTLEIAGRDPIRARAIVLGNGALHVPVMPDLPGLAAFRGKVFHSAQWDHQYDLANKTVAVVGTGASAIQFVPQIAPKVAKLHLFQRTAPWIVPKRDREMRPGEKRRFRRFPWLHRLYRAAVYALLESRVPAFVTGSRLGKLTERFARAELARAVPDPELRRKVTPDFAIGCKRILLSNDYYPALQRPNVEVVTAGIERVTAEGIVDRTGVLREVDAIVCGTGFAANDHMAAIPLYGKGGVSLTDASRAKPEHYLGITVHGFPNLYFLMGPNTGLGHNSMIFMIEAQARYAVQGIRALDRSGAASLEVRADVQRRFDGELEKRLGRMVWSSGCSSWYLRDGKNRTLWPGFTVAYWWRTRRLDLADYELAPRAS
jgi:cation diffusion facilitator CzcD-associated flavoprotein CzcO